MPKLVRALNQTVMIANPAYFGDDQARQLILVDIDAAGLWFSGEALHALPVERGLAPLPADAAATVFFPFAQIGYLYDPHQFATIPPAVGAVDRMLDHPPLARPPITPPAAATQEGAPDPRAQDGPRPKRPRIRR